MSANFDWQTEEDERRTQSGWDDVVETGPDRPPRRPLPWRLIAVVVVLVAAVGGIIWWRVDRRVSATLQAFRTDVIASHNLIQRAAADGDEEIFRSVLSGRMPTWTAGALEVFHEQLLFDRSPLGLIPVEGSLPFILSIPDEEAALGEQAADITFSPDLNEAVVTVNQPYQREGSPDTVVLQQTTVFRRGDSRWLLSPPMDEFWGDWITVEGQYLNLIYPARDEPVAGRLAEDLDAEIGRLCATLEEINCSADLQLTVRLDTDPATLASLSSPLGALRRAREREDILELPAPTLVGLPLADDNDGYAALRDGYARHLLAAVIAQAVGWRCCDEELLFDLILEYQLGELGLKTWPVGEAEYQRVLDSRIRLSDLGVFLRGRFPSFIPAEREWELRTAVDFLASGVPGVTTTGMQRALQRSRNFERFLNEMLANAEPDTSAPYPGLDLAFWLHAFEMQDRTGESLSPPEDEELYLACTAVDGNQSSDTSTLLRYSPDEQHWTEMYSLQGFVWMSALPNPEMLLLQEFALEGESWRTNIWRDGGSTPAYAGDEGLFAISFGETDPDGRRMVTYAYDPDAESVRSFLLNLSDCDDGCTTSELAGLPFWSPDGRWAVYAGDNRTFPQSSFLAANERYIVLQSTDGFEDVELNLGPGDAEPDSPELSSIGRGHSPFWVNERTFGYIRRAEVDDPAAQAGEEIVIASVDDRTPELVLASSDILNFLPEELPARRLSLTYVATHPAHPNRLFIVATDLSEQRAYVILYDLDERLPEVRLQMLANLNHSLSFSPDGRYLVMTGQDRRATPPDDNSGVLLVHNIAENRTFPFLTRLPFFLPSVVYDWSADGRWLAVALEDKLVGLIAPDERHVSLIAHNYDGCTSVAWLQP
jgi:hypothetical protein